MQNIPFETGKMYHIYTRSNSGENLFKEEDNYLYFLKLYSRYFEHIVVTYAYCLMPNHFHFLVEVITEIDPNQRNPVSQALSNCLNAYTKAFNIRNNRKGSLFQEHPKRKYVEDSQYYTALLHYIHLNPVRHGFCKSPDEWIYSSYRAFISPKPTRLARETVLDWYGGIQGFETAHKSEPDFNDWTKNEIEKYQFLIQT